MDTPGLREVGVWNVAPQELDHCFPEWRALRATCRFRDCRHREEPGCAVREAVEAGVVDAARYESYRDLQTELESAPPTR
jgi:ribosome biogenesis GTPase